MAYKEYLKRCADRDERLWLHHLAHPKMSQTSLANEFHISQSRVSKILKKKRARPVKEE